MNENLLVLKGIYQTNPFLLFIKTKKKKYVETAHKIWNVKGD